MIAFACSSCGKALYIKEEFAGRACVCPSCKAPLVVPAPDATVTNLPEPASSATDARQESLLARQAARGERYDLVGEIARGGMGAVSKATDRDIRREVAVKYMLDDSDPSKARRFIEEAQITGQLEHPNIVPIHELGVDARRRLFFSMKMVHGKSLAQVIRELRDIPRVAAREFPLSRLLTVFVGVCNALAYAHSRGVIHRDLKPANIMVGDFGEVYVMDWGLAKVLAQDEADDRIIVPGRSIGRGAIEEEKSSLTQVETGRGEGDMTRDGTVIGTPAYMPPEQATGRIEAIDRRSDIYSLGAVLYELLALQPPIDKEGGVLAILLRVAEGKVVPPQERDPARARAGQIPSELAAVAMKALATRPETRYQDVESLRRDVERFQAGRSVSAKEDSRWEAAVKFARRNRALTVSAAVVFLVLLGSMGLITRAWLETRDANAAFLKEEAAKRERTQKAVPALVEAARLAVERRRYENANAQVDLALDYDPDHEGARLLKGQLLILRKDFAGARDELDRYRQHRPKDREAARLHQLCGVARPGEPANLLALAHVFEQQKWPTLASGLLTEHGRDSFEARTKLLELFRKRIEATWRGLGGHLTLDASGIFRLDLYTRTQVVDLMALEGMPLTWLNLDGCSGVRDLTPLKGMPLTFLSLNGCVGVRDLPPLEGMALTSLDLTNCREVADLVPLAGMPLTSLQLTGCAGVREISTLKGMPLSRLDMAATAVQDLSPLKGMSLTALNLYNCAGVQDLTPLKGMPLSTLNLLGCARVSDLSPLKGMPLPSLNISDTAVHDLSPLKGMSLNSLYLTNCAGVRDLTPLKDIPLTKLDLGRTAIRDLTPLKGMPLTWISLNGCGGVRELAALEKMPLARLDLVGTSVENLNSLKGMPLTYLDLQETPVQDLTPLKGMPLTQLILIGARVEDLTPLEGMKLSTIHLPLKITKGMDVLRRMKSLTSIDNIAADDFWKKHDTEKAKK